MADVTQNLGVELAHRLELVGIRAEQTGDDPVTYRVDVAGQKIRMTLELEPAE
jgi:hypothetical protein